MEILKQDYSPGFTFTIQTPQEEGNNKPFYVAKCVILEHTPQLIIVFFVVGDWLATTFSLPTPRHLENLPYAMYLSIREITLKERVEFLCTI